MAKAENPRAVEGDNSSHSVAADELRAFIERVENIETEIADRQGDRKEIYSEAKGRGYSVKTIRRIVRERKQDREAAAEAEALYDTYTAALGGVFA